MYSRGISCDFEVRLTCFAPSANSFSSSFFCSFFFCSFPPFFVTKGFQNNFQELRKPRDFCDSCTPSRCHTLPWRRSTSILLRGLLHEVIFRCMVAPFECMSVTLSLPRWSPVMVTCHSIHICASTTFLKFIWISYIFKSGNLPVPQIVYWGTFAPWFNLSKID